MPATETRLVPPRPEDRIGPIFEVGRDFYSITRKGDVWVDPQNGEGHYLTRREEYPQDIVDELKRLGILPAHPSNAVQWAAHAEEHAVYIRLGRGISAEYAFVSVCEPLILKAIDIGQFSVKMRLVLNEGEARPPTQAAIDEFKKLLEKYGCMFYTGPWVTELADPNSSVPQVNYLWVTISWNP